MQRVLVKYIFSKRFWVWTVLIPHLPSEWRISWNSNKWRSYWRWSKTNFPEHTLQSPGRLSGTARSWLWGGGTREHNVVIQSHIPLESVTCAHAMRRLPAMGYTHGESIHFPLVQAPSCRRGLKGGATSPLRNCFRIKWLRWKMVLLLAYFWTDHMLKDSHYSVNFHFCWGLWEGCVVQVEGWQLLPIRNSCSC